MLYIIILISGFLLSFFGPWWIAAAAAWLICFWKAQSGGKAFLQSGLAVLSIWLIYALFIQSQGSAPFVDKIAGILTSKADGIGHLGNMALIYGICLIIALLLGGIAGFAGFQMKKFNRAN
ncbi:hypothetical protein LAG90_13995 [Marinilongibacter aquaticus]|uniref:hypothetical protein n=1 Tax=Marinilongibacter aquaticus TaxID=2975157 RepID=UPI0021BCFF5E|nr:hypothetical protein [Marinilongibacter aquaticus]UBM57916.1 hypothetical protein LAG90_13995 [Marinilongibacter aquaticus]